MRILMVGSNFQAMWDDVRYAASPRSISLVRVTSRTVTFTDGSVVHVERVSGMDDLHKLRGQRFDFVIEHPSFPRDVELYAALHAITQR